jgi:hypothetical protein
LLKNCEKDSSEAENEKSTSLDLGRVISPQNRVLLTLHFKSYDVKNLNGFAPIVYCIGEECLFVNSFTFSRGVDE